MLRIAPIAAGLAALAVVALALTFAPSGPRTVAALTNCSAGSGAMDGTEQQMLQLFNNARAQAGAGPLAANTTLANAAAWMVEDMLANNYFRHEPDSLGRTFAQRMVQCDVTKVGSPGENLAFGSSNPGPIMDLWMSSPGHCGAILHAGYTSVGIAQVSGVWAAVFAGSGIPTQCGSTPTPTPTRTPTPTPSASPSPIVTLSPTVTPSATATPTAPPPASTVTPAPSPKPRQQAGVAAMLARD